MSYVCHLSTLRQPLTRSDFDPHLLEITNDSAKERSEGGAQGLLRLGKAIPALTTLLIPIALGKESVPSDCQMHGSRAVRDP